jgi:hypothetical protein
MTEKDAERDQLAPSEPAPSPLVASALPSHISMQVYSTTLASTSFAFKHATFCGGFVSGGENFESCKELQKYPGPSVEVLASLDCSPIIDHHKTNKTSE